MNKDSDSSDIEDNNLGDKSVDNSPVERLSIEVLDRETRERNKLVKEEFLINLDTSKVVGSKDETVKKNYFRNLSTTGVFNKLLSPQKIVGKNRTGSRSGSRSDPGVVHIQLETDRKKRVTKSNMDLTKAVGIIPICTGKNDIAEFINACEIALNDVVEKDKELLLKIITSKLSGNALEATKYRTLDSWESIKSILQGAFEQKISERALTIGMNTARMAEGESVAKFASRIEEYYYKLCNASTLGLSPAEAVTVKNQIKKQAMIVFMTGLPDYLYLVLKARDPKTLETAIQVAQDEEIEYQSRIKIEGMQNNVGNQNVNKNEIQKDSKNQNDSSNGYNKNNFNNRGANGNVTQYNRNNNFNNRGGNSGFNRNFNNNGYGNRYNNFNSNRGGYNNIGQRQNYNGNNNYQRNNIGQRQNYNENNSYQRNNNINQNRNNNGCYVCGKMNHFAKDCWQNTSQGGNRQTAINRDNNNRNANNGVRNNNNNNSNNRGNATNQSLHCSYCNKLGHEISSCFTKQKNERNNVGNSKNSRGPPQSGVRYVHEIRESSQEDASTSQQN